MSRLFVDLCYPANHTDLALVRVALQAAGIRHYVVNEFATLGSYSAIGADQLCVRVPAEDVAPARAAVARSTS